MGDLLTLDQLIGKSLQLQGLRQLLSEAGKSLPGFVFWRMVPMSRMEDVSIPGEPQQSESGLIRQLTIAAGALTAASILVNLILQIAQFLRKRPVEPDQRDKLKTVGLALTVLKQLRPLIKQVRLLADQIKRVP
jgi:hypothetical protein